MAVASEKSYEAIIQQLKAYHSAVFEDVNKMRIAGSACVKKFPKDPAATKSVANLEKELKNISNQLQEITKIITALNKEMEQIKKVAATASYSD